MITSKFESSIFKTVSFENFFQIFQKSFHEKFEKIFVDFDTRNFQLWLFYVSLKWVMNYIHLYTDSMSHTLDGIGSILLNRGPWDKEVSKRSDNELSTSGSNQTSPKLATAFLFISYWISNSNWSKIKILDSDWLKSEFVTLVGQNILISSHYWPVSKSCILIGQKIKIKFLKHEKSSK